MTSMMPSIALPTGPYDWHPERIPRATFELRVAMLRSIMARRGATHAIVHGNGFDHAALAWLTHFTPKLGPAYALIPAAGPLRLLFAGGPGMKPSAQRLTWVEDVAALRGIEGDARRWLEESSGGGNARLGLVEGASMLRGDWLAVGRAAGGTTIELDASLDAALAGENTGNASAAALATGALAVARETIARLARPGADVRTAVIAMERAAYAAGAQDVRVRIARRPGGLPGTPPDEALPLNGALRMVVAVRAEGAWSEASLTLEA